MGICWGWVLLSYGGLHLTPLGTVQSFEQPYGDISDGLVVTLWSVGDLALTLLAVWLGWGGEFLSFG